MEFNPIETFIDDMMYSIESRLELFIFRCIQPYGITFDNLKDNASRISIFGSRKYPYPYSFNDVYIDDKYRFSILISNYDIHRFKLDKVDMCNYMIHKTSIENTKIENLYCYALYIPNWKDGDLYESRRSLESNIVITKYNR